MLQSSELLRQRIAADITAQLPAGTFNLSIEQSAIVLGMHPGHIRNQISQSVFPVETILIGKRRLIPLTNLIDYLAGLIIGHRKVEKPKRGRRTKAMQRSLREQQAANTRMTELGGI